MQVTPYNQIGVFVSVVTPGSSEAYTNIPAPATILVIPSGSAYVEYAINPSMNAWYQWPKGLVFMSTEDVLHNDIAALRLTVISGSATMQILTGGQNE